MRKLSFFFLFLPICFCEGQNIFSESQYDSKKPFAPYEISNMVGLNDQEFILLLEEGKGKFRLVRYDEYFLDRWSKILDYNREGSFPKLIKLGDDVAVFRFWTMRNSAFAEIRIYDVLSGELISEKREKILEVSSDPKNIKIEFSSDFSEFLLYNFQTEDGDFELFDVYDTREIKKLHSYQIESYLTMNKTKGVFVNGNGDTFIALGDPGTFTIDTYFFSGNAPSQPVRLSTSFTFSRPANTFSRILICKQSESAFFVTTAANVDKDLVGVNVTSFNVVLKSVLFSNSYDLDQEFIQSLYEMGLTTTEDQKKRFLKLPDQLTNFDLQEILIDTEGNITAIFEKQDIVSTFHDPAAALNMTLKWQEIDDQVFFSEDILLLNFNSTGEILWNTVIQKSQSEKGSGLGMSYVSDLKDMELKLLLQQRGNGNSFYYYKINTVDGELISEKSFLDKKITYNKNYSGWVDGKTLLLCTFSPGSNNRTFYLVEF